MLQLSDEDIIAVNLISPHELEKDDLKRQRLLMLTIERSDVSSLIG